MPLPALETQHKTGKAPHICAEPCLFRFSFVRQDSKILSLRLSNGLPGLAERLHGSGIFRPLFLDGILQEHILHLYGVSGLASPNLSQVVPFIKGFLCCHSQPVTGFPTYS